MRRKWQRQLLVGLTLLLAPFALTAAESTLGEATLLLEIARTGKLSDAQAARAAELLDDRDPFTRAIAEFAIALRVTDDNRGRVVVWPKADPPAWFRRWMRVTPQQRLDFDYVRQAEAVGALRSASALVRSAEDAVRGAEQVAAYAKELRSPRHRDCIQNLAAARRALSALRAVANGGQADASRLHTLWLNVRHATRKVVLSNPNLDFPGLVYVTRHSAHAGPNITTSHFPWVHKPGGDIVVQTGLEPGSPRRSVLSDQLGPGHVHGIDLWWDADRVVFGYARQPGWEKYPAPQGNDSQEEIFLVRSGHEPIHLYEIQLDGRGLRQITSHAAWSDLEPTYLPGGDVVFASQRPSWGSMCGAFEQDRPIANLYRVSSDGKQVRRLTFNKDIDRYPHTFDDGRIGFVRWDYQERHFYEPHAIWTVRPDGTMADAVYKQHIAHPFSLRDTRSIPGSNKLISIGAGHHTFAYGSVIVVDPFVGINNPEGMRVVTPFAYPQEGPPGGSPVDGGGVKDNGGVYQTPWALSENSFLVSYSYDRYEKGRKLRHSSNFGAYYIDVWGNKELLHRDPLLSVAFPMPLQKRAKPPVVPEMTAQPGLDYGIAYVNDVYSDMPGVARGTIKYLRIAERAGWPIDERLGELRYKPGPAWAHHFGYWAWAPARVIGTVNVEPDGSAYFKVPAETSVYFQALDENFMEVRRMRSHVEYQRGEIRGCVGCHETKGRVAAGNTHYSAALRRAPQLPVAPPWGDQKLIDYEELVQPILDRHCVSCHSGKTPAGSYDFGSIREPDGFLRSYRSIFGLLPGEKPIEGPGAWKQIGEKTLREQYFASRAEIFHRDFTPVIPGRQLVALSDRFSDSSITQPYEFGSHKSRFILVLLRDEAHRRAVKLSSTEWQTLVTWVDTNAQYYGSFLRKRGPDGLLLENPERVTVALPPPFRSSPEPLTNSPGHQERKMP